MKVKFENHELGYISKSLNALFELSQQDGAPDYKMRRTASKFTPNSSVVYLKKSEVALLVTVLSFVADKLTSMDVATQEPTVIRSILEKLSNQVSEK